MAKKTLDDLLKGDKSAAQILELRQQLRHMAEAKATVEIDLPKKDAGFKFGVISCTHLGSLYEDISVTRGIYEWFHQEGIDTVFHCGDMTEGCQMRPGQEHEIHKHGADDQVKWTVDNYPFISGMKTLLIAGNHDAAHMKNGGSDVCARIADKREDIVYLGADAARFVANDPSGRSITIDMLHPGGGSSYALSYKPQKIIEQLEISGQPDILLIGHFHKAFTLPAYRGVCAILAGCTQRQSGFMKRMGLAAHVGGHIVEAKVMKDFGQVQINSCWRGFL